MTYTQPLAGAADVASPQLNTCWLGGAALNIQRGNKSERVSCGLQADSGAADRGNKIRRDSPIVAASGGAGRALEVTELTVNVRS